MHVIVKNSDFAKLVWTSIFPICRLREDVCMDKKDSIIRAWQAIERIEMLAQNYRGINLCKPIDDITPDECDAELKELEAFCEQIEQYIFIILEEVYA